MADRSAQLYKRAMTSFISLRRGSCSTAGKPTPQRSSNLCLNLAVAAEVMSRKADSVAAPRRMKRLQSVTDNWDT